MQSYLIFKILSGSYFCKAMGKSETAMMCAIDSHVVFWGLCIIPEDALELDSVNCWLFR